MKFKYSSHAMTLLTTGTITSLFILVLSSPALADSKAADLKTAEAKVTEPSAAAPSDTDFKNLDSNSDDRISLKEAVKDKVLINVFDATDANHDGMITADEYASYKAALAVKSADSPQTKY